MHQSNLELVEVIEMLMQSQIEYPIVKTKYSTYLVDYPDATKNIEGVISNEKLFDIYQGHEKKIRER